LNTHKAELYKGTLMSDDMLNGAEFVGEEVGQEIAEQPQEQEDAIAEEAPASEEQHEPKSNGYEKRIHKLTAQKYEHLDEINRLKAEKEELERRYQASPVQTEQASIQPIGKVEMPNPDLQFDDPVKYQEQLIAYNQQLWREQQESERLAQENARRQQEQQEQARQRQAEFAQKAETLGVDADKALQSAALLQQRGINDIAAQMLVEHPAAPALFEHLASNPVAFEDLNNAGGYLATAEKLKALESQAVTRNISSAPEPTPSLSGLSAREPDEFDKLCPGAEWV
jgi:hypothetical protein